MINEVIENIRNHLYETTDINELTNDYTIRLSHELNELMNLQIKMNTTNRYGVDYSNSNVHVNAIKNIIEVSSKEKFDLPYLLSKSVLKNKEWFKIDFINSILTSIDKAYGSDAVEHIGKFVPENCIFPNVIDNFSECVENLNNIYYLNHKSNVYIGQYLPHKLIKNEIHLFCHTPHYPTAFNRGILKGMAEKFNHGVNITVKNNDHGGEFKIVL